MFFEVFIRRFHYLFRQHFVVVVVVVVVFVVIVVVVVVVVVLVFVFFLDVRRVFLLQWNLVELRV